MTNEVATQNEQVPAIQNERLPWHPAFEDRFGIVRNEYRALVEAVFPTATTPNSILLALSYCKARNLDPFKRCVHIVPIWNNDLKRMVDTIWPGIGELRTTAARTGEYAGKDDTVFGPDLEEKIGTVDMVFPEWAQVTVYRIVKGVRCPFVGPRVHWKETYARQSRNDKSPNNMWKQRTRGQLDKCAEAAALRTAFPEEVGNDYIPEEAASGNVSIEEVQSHIQTVAAQSLEEVADNLAAKTLEGETVTGTGDTVEEPAAEEPPPTHEQSEPEGEAPDLGETPFGSASDPLTPIREAMSNAADAGDQSTVRTLANEAIQNHPDRKKEIEKTRNHYDKEAAKNR